MPTFHMYLQAQRVGCLKGAYVTFWIRIGILEFPRFNVSISIHLLLPLFAPLSSVFFFCSYTDKAFPAIISTSDSYGCYFVWHWYVSLVVACPVQGEWVDNGPFRSSAPVHFIFLSGIPLFTFLAFYVCSVERSFTYSLSVFVRSVGLGHIAAYLTGFSKWFVDVQVGSSFCYF